MPDVKSARNPCRGRAMGYPRSARSASSGVEELHASLGARLRELRIERGVSRYAMARAVGLPLHRVQEHECGVRRIEPDKLLAYALCLGVRALSFFVPPRKPDARAERP